MEMQHPNSWSWKDRELWSVDSHQLSALQGRSEPSLNSYPSESNLHVVTEQSGGVKAQSHQPDVVYANRQYFTPHSLPVWLKFRWTCIAFQLLPNSAFAPFLSHKFIPNKYLIYQTLGIFFQRIQNAQKIKQ